VIALAIDIGLTGALAAVDSYGKARVVDLPTLPDGQPVKRKSKKTGKATETQPMRLDGRGLIRLIREFVALGEPAMLVIEDIRPRPMGNGSSHGNTMHSQGSLMRSRGVVEAVAGIGGWEMVTVRPQEWKKHFGLIRKKSAGPNGEDETDEQCKARGRALAATMYPSLAADLKRVKDHNRADAVLLAHWLQGEKA
jgi:hypothetical protein